MADVFITGVGRFLPGKPVPNADIENIIGRISQRSAALGKATLRKNGIKHRHYSFQADGSYSHNNAQMAAIAMTRAAENAHRAVEDAALLATSTTQGDTLVPGFASAVHGELGISDVELASFQSVCAGSLMAVKHAWLSIKAGDTQFSLASGSEFSSRWFRPGFYQPFYNENSRPDPELEFLRWTLSDGAGAVALEPQPKADGRSLRIDWIKQKSFADRFPNCMYAGARANTEAGALPWNLYENPGLAWQAGAIALKQDVDVLYQMFPAWIGYFLELVDTGLVDPDATDYFLPHYSAHSLREEMIRLLEKTGAMIDESRWFNNIVDCGNTGSASIFIMLEELIRTRDLEPGQKLLCFVPESGRAICAFMQLTVV